MFNPSTHFTQSIILFLIEIFFTQSLGFTTRTQIENHWHDKLYKVSVSRYRKVCWNSQKPCQNKFKSFQLLVKIMQLFYFRMNMVIPKMKSSNRLCKLSMKDIRNSLETLCFCVFVICWATWVPITNFCLSKWVTGNADVVFHTFLMLLQRISPW